MGQIISDVSDILNYKETKNTNEKNKNKILADIASDEQEKQNIVKKVLGAQRAKYGAAGLSSGGLSEKNVLDATGSGSFIFSTVTSSSVSALLPVITGRTLEASHDTRMAKSKSSAAAEIILFIIRSPF